MTLLFRCKKAFSSVFEMILDEKIFFYFGEFLDFSGKTYSRIVNKELTNLTLKRNTFE